MQKLKTINIKGKKYVTVAERIKYFRTHLSYRGWRLITEIINLSNDNSSCLFKASVLNEEGTVISIGHAYEEKESSFINRTSFVEVGETSAIGRALGNLGIGIEESVASYDEVVNAMLNSHRSEANNPINPFPEDFVKKTIDEIKETTSLEHLQLLWKRITGSLKVLSKVDEDAIVKAKDEHKKFLKNVRERELSEDVPYGE
jgi:hypothetical protein